MNAICLQSALESLGVATRVQTAIEMKVRHRQSHNEDISIRPS